MNYHHIVQLTHLLLVFPLLTYAGYKGYTGKKISKLPNVILIVLGVSALIGHIGLISFYDMENFSIADISDFNRKVRKWFTSPKTHYITLYDMEFHPKFITVRKGDRIKWTNKDDMKHNVSSYNGAFHGGEMEPSDEITTIFDSTGVFNYHCNIHPYMRGSVTVVTANDIEKNT